MRESKEAEGKGAQAVVLAAGESRRMGSPKPLLRIGPDTFLGLILRRLREAGVEEVSVVLGAEAERIRGAFPDEAARFLLNREYERGQLSSLHVALRALPEDTAGVLLCLVDHPLVGVETYGSVLREGLRERGRIVIPTFGGRSGHPVYFAGAFFGDLLAAPLEGGAREVVRRHPDRVLRISVEDPGILRDIDTPERYEEIVREAEEKG